MAAGGDSDPCSDSGNSNSKKDRLTKQSHLRLMHPGWFARIQRLRSRLCERRIADGNCQ